MTSKTYVSMAAMHLHLIEKEHLASVVLVISSDLNDAKIKMVQVMRVLRSSPCQDLIRTKSCWVKR